MVFLVGSRLYRCDSRSALLYRFNGCGRGFPQIIVPGHIAAHLHRLCHRRLYVMDTCALGLLTIVMVMGACAGSTSGGLKCIRMVILAKVSRNECKHLLHPNAVLPVRINKQVIPLPSYPPCWHFSFYILSLSSSAY